MMSTQRIFTNSASGAHGSRRCCPSLLTASAIAVACFLTQANAVAGTVELILEVDEIAKTWIAKAQITDTTISFETGIADPGETILGIAGFTIDVVGSGGVTIDPTVALVTPTGFDNTGSLEVTGFGFGAFTGNWDGTSVTSINDAQETFGSGIVSDPRTVIEGPGLFAGTDGSFPIAAVWDAPLALASGTYSGINGSIELRTTNVVDIGPGNEALTLLFGDPTAGANGFDNFENVEFAADVSSDIHTIVPEPSTVLLTLLGLASGACLGRSRR